MLGDYLAAEGFEVGHAGNGQAGVDAVAASEYSLVVMDITMPVMDGFEALRRIRQFSEVPVLMLTARGDELDRIVGLELGADDYLPKPFNPRELAARLKAILRRARPVAPVFGDPRRSSPGCRDKAAVCERRAGAGHRDRVFHHADPACRRRQRGRQGPAVPGSAGSCADPVRSQSGYARQQPAAQTRHDGRRRGAYQDHTRARIPAERTGVTGVSRFYWRLFLAFVLVILVTTMVSATVGTLLLGSAVDSSRQESLRATLSAVAAQAELVLASGGETALRGWLQEQQAELAVPLLVVTPQQRELLGRPLPPGGERLFRRLQRADASDRSSPSRRGPPIRRLSGPNGQVYLLMVSPRPRFAGGRFQQPALRAVFFVVLLLVGALACLALARYLVRPVRALRSAGQALGAGDLDARAGPAMRARKDEFGALARDFDQMAERVQDLVANQQRLLRDVSHELRSPLARLQIAAGLLRQQSDTAALPQVDRIEREVSKLDQLIGQVLGFARLSSLEHIERQPLDLVELLSELVADARFEGQAVGIDVVFDTTGPLPFSADERLLSSALENVIRNAIQHARARVEISCKLASGGEVQIRVRDDGPGVEPDQQSTMFEPFKRRARWRCRRGARHCGPRSGPAPRFDRRRHACCRRAGREHQITGQLNRRCRARGHLLKSRSPEPLDSRRMRPRFGSWLVLSTCVLALLLMLWAQLIRADETPGPGSGAGTKQVTESGLAGQRFGQRDAMVGAVAVVVEDVLGTE